MKDKDDQQLFAFWRYDKFPYLLGGRVAKFHAKGRIEAKGYQGYSFHPILLVVNEEGEQLREALINLKEEKVREQAELDLKYIRKLEILLIDYPGKADELVGPALVEQLREAINHS